MIFFGFCLAEIECPRNIKIPLLPFKYQSKTIHPKGKWIHIYFSEELKAAQKHGYKINLIRGYEFSKIDLFSKYVNFFYNEKKIAQDNSAAKFIAKMQLNQLYGIFGRKQESIETINVKRKDLINYITTRVVKNIIEINDDVVTLLVSTNLDYNILKQLNYTFIDKNYDFKNSYTYGVKSNVAIASQVTSYARIFMMEFKTDPDIEIEKKKWNY